jgi:hypothetical protein
MDPSKDQSAINLPLAQLVARALSELEKLRYSRRSLRRYRTVWRQLVAFARRMNLGGDYSADLAARFSDAYRMRDGECLKPGERWRRHVVFGLKVLGDFAREGSFERPRIDKQSIQVPVPMKKPLREYEQYCRDRRYLRPATLYVRMHEIVVFADFLRSRNITSLDQLQPADVSVNFHARMTRFGVGLTRKADQPDTLRSLSGATWSDMRGDDRQDTALAPS